MKFERISSQRSYSGVIASVRSDRYRYEDGSVSDREIVEHPGAVAIVAVDGMNQAGGDGDAVVWLVRQPREAVGEASLLEIPAGKLDVEGESRIDCAKRELGEEIGREASEWEELKRIWTSPGFAEEEVTVFLASQTRELSQHEPSAEERIEIVAWPLGELEEAIAECSDAKSLIGLMLLRERLGRRSAG